MCVYACQRREEEESVWETETERGLGRRGRGEGLID